MAKRVGQKIKMTSIDELLCVPSVAGCDEIEVAKIRPFKDHPFKVLDDEKMHELVESIMLNGVLVPVTVRPLEDGDYEMISGHRRLFAVKEIGFDKIPAIVKKYDDDEAVLAMVDSNLQREEILPSEKAFAYKMKVDALKHQGARHDRTSARGVPKLQAREQVALDAGEKSHMAVTRYISLTKLIPPLLALVDEDKLAVSAAADYISILTEQEQTDFISVMNKLDVIPTKSQMAKIKQYSKDGTLTAAVMDAVLSEQKPAPVQVTLKKERLEQYFPATYSTRQMEEVIFSLLETWSDQHK